MPTDATQEMTELYGEYDDGEMTPGDIEDILGRVPLEVQAVADAALDEFYAASSIEERAAILRGVLGMDDDRDLGALAPFTLDGGDRAALRLTLLFELAYPEDADAVLKEKEQLERELEAVDRLIATVRTRMTDSVR